MTTDDVELTVSQQTRLEEAYAKLEAELGRAPGEKKVREAASVSMVAAKTFMAQKRQYALNQTMPEADLVNAAQPHVKAMLTAVWNAAHKMAQDGVPELIERESSDLLDEMRADVAEAESERDKARVERDQAIERVAQVEAERDEAVAAAQAQRDEAIAQANAERDEAMKAAEAVQADAARVPELEARIAALELEIVKKDAVLDFMTAQRTDMTELRDMLTKLSADKNDDAVEPVESDTPGM